MGLFGALVARCRDHLAHVAHVLGNLAPVVSRYSDKPHSGLDDRQVDASPEHPHAADAGDVAQPENFDRGQQAAPDRQFLDSILVVVIFWGSSEKRFGIREALLLAGRNATLAGQRERRPFEFPRRALWY